MHSINAAQNGLISTLFKRKRLLQQGTMKQFLLTFHFLTAQAADIGIIFLLKAQQKMSSTETIKFSNSCSCHDGRNQGLFAVFIHTGCYKGIFQKRSQSLHFLELLILPCHMFLCSMYRVPSSIFSIITSSSDSPQIIKKTH